MKTTILAAAVALVPLAGIAADDDAVAVVELRSRLGSAQKKQIDAAALTDQVRDVARRLAPQVTENAKEAARVVSGEIVRAGQTFLVSLSLRDAEGRPLASVSATGASLEELKEAVAAAAVDLFRPQAAAAVPEAPQALPEALQLPADANVLVAYDKARQAEVRGKEHPAEAAAAWHAVAELGGKNPFRDEASARAQQWQLYADTRHAWESQLASDKSRLRKVLPLASVTDAAKLDLLVHFDRSYGAAETAPLVALLPDPALREKAQLALGCEEKDGSKCVLLAHAADEAHDAKLALQYLDDGCAAGAADACAEAGERWLNDDAARAMTSLQKACDLASARGCARLARVFEEGEGTDVDLARGAQLRQKACDAGDGKSCRRLACVAAEEPLALALWKKGCADGDVTSCTLASLSEPRPEPTPPAISPAPPPAGRAVIATALAEEKKAAQADEARRKRAGATLIGTAFVLGTGAAFIALQDDRDNQLRRQPRNYMTMQSHDYPGLPRGVVALTLASAALITGGVGLTLLATSPEKPESPKVSVGVSPAGLFLAGTLP